MFFSLLCSFFSRSLFTVLSRKKDFSIPWQYSTYILLFLNKCNTMMWIATIQYWMNTLTMPKHRWINLSNRKLLSLYQFRLWYRKILYHSFSLQWGRTQTHTHTHSHAYIFPANASVNVNWSHAQWTVECIVIFNSSYIITCIYTYKYLIMDCRNINWDTIE